jgi:hypothetical protein
MMRVVPDTPPPHQQYKRGLRPLLLTKLLKRLNRLKVRSGGPLRTTLLEIDRIIASVEPGRDTEGAIAPESSTSKGRRLKNHLSKTVASTYNTWEASNFLKRTYQS